MVQKRRCVLWATAYLKWIVSKCKSVLWSNDAQMSLNCFETVVRTACHIVGGELPSLQDIYTRRCTRKARRIIKDSSHQSHSLLSLLPSGRRLRSIRSRTSRLRDSFFPQAIRLMNSQKKLTYITLPLTQHTLHFNTVLPDYTHTLH